MGILVVRRVTNSFGGVEIMQNIIKTDSPYEAITIAKMKYPANVKDDKVIGVYHVSSDDILEDMQQEVENSDY